MSSITSSSLRALSAALVALGSCTHAAAHLGYGTARDFGTLLSGSNVSIATQTVTSNYGWADASDLSLAFNTTAATTPRVDEATYISGNGSDDLLLGDSHKGKAFRLHIDSVLSVTFSASARADSGLTPAFSVYRGLAALSPFTAPQTSADHDYNPASQAWRSAYAAGTAGAGYDHLATNGSWNALGNWAMGGDGDPANVTGVLSQFTYAGSAFSTVANGAATTTLLLGPGDYTVMVGGNNIGSKNLTDSTKAYAFTLGVSAVSSVPEPSSMALLLSSLAMAGVARLRRMRA